MVNATKPAGAAGFVFAIPLSREIREGVTYKFINQPTFAMPDQ